MRGNENFFWHFSLYWLRHNLSFFFCHCTSCERRNEVHFHLVPTSQVALVKPPQAGAPRPIPEHRPNHYPQWLTHPGVSSVGCTASSATPWNKSQCNITLCQFQPQPPKQSLKQQMRRNSKGKTPLKLVAEHPVKHKPASVHQSDNTYIMFQAAHSPESSKMRKLLVNKAQTITASLQQERYFRPIEPTECKQGRPTGNPLGKTLYVQAMTSASSTNSDPQQRHWLHSMEEFTNNQPSCRQTLNHQNFHLTCSNN